MIEYLPSILAWLAVGAAWLLLHRTREAIHKAPDTVRQRAAEDAARRSGA